MSEDERPNDESSAGAVQRRRYPRIRPNHPISIRLPDETVKTNLIQDISRGGMRLQCDRETAALFHPDGGRITPENAPKIELRIDFPIAEKIESVSVSCRICYVRGNVAGTIDLGIEFVEFEGQSFELFQQYVQESLLPAT